MRILSYTIIMKIRYCSICGSTNYYCKNLCRSCYQKSLVPKNWSKNFSKCVKCGTTNYPHIGQGLCSHCYASRKSNILCACGCGEVTTLRGNKPKKFLQGHWLHLQGATSKFQTNHTKSMLGENNPMFGLYGSSHPAFGHKTSDKTRQERRERRLKYISTKGKPTNIEIILSHILDEMNLNHNAQTILYNKFTVDEFLPEYGLVIEANGGYWHGDKRRFPILSKKQIRIQKRDASKASYLIICGHRVLVLWERELVNNPEWCKNEISLAIKDFLIPLLQDSIK